MRIGVDYYPEHWPRERWAIDMTMMKNAGIRVVRLAEFSWSLLEPDEGVYDFSWLDEAVEMLWDQGISIVMSTPTATPPKWLVDAYPSVLATDRFGRTRHFGSRRHYCPNNAAYIEKTAEIVHKLGERYGKHPAVQAWQIDNEFGNENSMVCFCPSCEKKWQTWLEKKFKTVDELNARWGTVFWSQTYNTFAAVDLPRAPQCEESCSETHGLNPSLCLDFNRFSSDSIVKYATMQTEILKKYTSASITTNLMGTYSGIDYYKLAAPMDFMSWDNYISTQWGRSAPYSAAMGHALIRSIKKNVPMWVMEQQSGPCGWSKMGDMPKPGQLRLWSWQSVAGGADTVMYFRWRPALFGTEEYWYGILDHDGGETRRYHEIKQTGMEFENIAQKLGKLTFGASVGIIRSYENLWSHRIHSHSIGFSAEEITSLLYRALFRRGIDGEFLSLDEPMSGYAVLLAPACIMADEAIAQRMRDYVQSGGHLLLTYRSGIKNLDNVMHPAPIPGVFADITGVQAEEFDPLGDRTIPLTGIFGQGTARIWCDVLKPVSANVLAEYSGEFYCGKAAVTENAVGQGRVYYLGCDADEETYDRLVGYICNQAGIAAEFTDIPDGVEIHKAMSEAGPVWFVLNHNQFSVLLRLKRTYQDVSTGETYDFTLRLEGYQPVVIQ